MVRIVLKYVYLVFGTGLAMLLGRLSPSERRQQHGEPRAPMEAATYRANELVRRPLRTLGLIVGYELLFAGTAVSAAYPDQVASVVGKAPIIFAGVVTSSIPDSLIPLLPPIGLALGIVFPLVVHQSLVTAGDIQLHLS
jgi:hypothetical protein